MRLETRVYRAHHPGWAFSPTSGQGASVHGGRFNRIGVPALYTSTTWQGAWTEAQQGFPFKAQPVTICAYEVDCENIEDLRRISARARLGIDPADLACPWEDIYHAGDTPPSWTLVDRLASVGVNGIIVPSFAPGATEDMHNIVFWSWSDAPPRQVRVIDDQMRLPRDRSSWL